MFDNRHGGGESNTDLVKGIFRAAAAARRRRTGSFDAGHAQQQQQRRDGVVDLNPELTQREAEDQTAAQFARQSSIAGYLSKLGSTIPTYKRRFFVLKPQTLLYYFVSADDVEPRGCLELDDRVVVGQEFERLDDGRCRFEVWVGGDGGGDCNAGSAEATESGGGKGQSGRRRVVLEAPNDETAQKWIEAISTERLSHTKSAIAKAQERERELQDKIKSLEKELEAMRAIKAERDTALEDVQHWRRRHQELDEGVRLLTRVVRRPPVPAGKKADGESGDDDQDNKQKEEEQQLLDLSIPDTSFASLRNVTGQLRSTTHLAVKDAEASAERVSSLETSLSKAEDRIQHLERENVVIRQDSQRRKRDNKILVKEVKNLRRSMEESRIEEDGRKKSADEAGKLMAELEAHVATTLQLQQKLLFVSSSGDNEAKEKAESDAEDTASEAGSRKNDAGQDADKKSDTADVPSPSKTPTKDNTHRAFASSREDDAVRPPVVSDSPSPIAPTKLALVDSKEDAKATKGSLIDDESSSSDEEDEDAEHNTIITETGQATSRLTCPLVDISSTNNTTGRATIESTASALSATGGEMYHLTFRSKKIGLQFQKVPASSTKRGSLSSAMADAHGPGRAEDGELGQIAAIARRTEANDGTQQDVNAKVAMPIDVVLVCGFHGFDDNVNPRRPDLGARLVAFDGISVELGSWTFDSIRRGIQARSRPITLSFRNDPLSIQEREILTKAVAELNDSTPPFPRPLPSHHRKGQANHMRGAEDDTSSVGTFRSNFSSLMPEPPPSPSGESFVSSSSAASSFISRLHHVHSAAGFGDMEASGNADESSYQSLRDMTSARHGGGPGDASSVISTGSARSRASGFFSGIAGKGTKNNDEKKPKFMTQESGSLNDHQHHRDFEASLL